MLDRFALPAFASSGIPIIIPEAAVDKQYIYEQSLKCSKENSCREDKNYVASLRFGEKGYVLKNIQTLL
jgi:hypothetical protein